MELFTGRQSPSALDVVVRVTGSGEEMLGITLDTVSQYLKRLRGSLHGLHHEVVDEKERRRLQAMVAKNGVAANFDIGGFVLWSRIDQRLPNKKLLGHWVGPFQVISALPHSFRIRHLVSGAEYEAHATRLKYNSDSNLNPVEDSWESADNTLKDVPDTVKAYVVNSDNELLQNYIG
ncbi:hypothetical protein PHMEG_00028535 [Phytophthora megakarya]|uniref:Uncharacterized protein n=1 Tax=Phytophthora megakarya TaxID=4795 RepID=A0A225V2X8_9STRA|nr:hypothetical protein PHMEG_00028535 [Phytophthora megakarya]